MSTKNRNPRIGDIQREDTIASLTSLLTQYTVQMDEFYKLAATTSVSLLTLIGVLITAAATIYVNISKVNKEQFLGILSYVILILPIIGTQVLYILSMSMRKEALYRAYCSEIEERLNGLTGTHYYSFHSEIVSTEMNRFLTNKWGGVFLGIVLSVLYALSFYASWKWSGYIGGADHGSITIWKVFVIAFILLDIGFSIMIVAGLLSNVQAMNKARTLFKESNHLRA